MFEWFPVLDAREASFRRSPALESGTALEYSAAVGLLQPELPHADVDAFLLERVLEASGDAVAILDDAGKIVRVNREMAIRSGQPTEQLIGEAWEAVAPPELQDAYRGLLSDVRAVREPVSWTSAYASRVWEDTLRPFEGPHEGEVWFLAHGRDITGRHEAEVAMRESELRFRTLAQESVFGIGLYDAQGLRFANRSLEDLLEVESSDVQSWVDLFASATSKGWKRLDLLATGASSSEAVVEFGARRTQLTARRVSVRGRDAVLLCAHDATETDRAQTATMQAEKEESMVALAGGLAHDFNNILVSILSGASMLQDELPGEPRLHELCDMIVAGSRRIAELTGKLLTYSRGAIFRPRPTDINRVVDDALELARSSIPTHTHLHLELDRSLPPIRGDAGQLQQVLVSLLVNAGEAMPERKGNIWIKTSLDVGAQFDNATVRLEVQDDGEGMSAETRRRLFEPFFTTRFQGRGMGLAATAGIVKAHGARIRVESEPGNGARFLIEFPVDLEATGSVVLGREAGGRPRSVLVVDDDPMVRKVMARILRRVGFEVHVAESGAQAIEIAQSGVRLGVLLVDIFMPGLSGDQVIRAVRAEVDDLPVVVCSGFSQDRALADVGTGVVQEFIMKPFPTEELVDCVERAHRVGRINLGGAT